METPPLYPTIVDILTHGGGGLKQTDNYRRGLFRTLVTPAEAKKLTIGFDGSVLSNEFLEDLGRRRPIWLNRIRNRRYKTPL